MRPCQAPTTDNVQYNNMYTTTMYIYIYQCSTLRFCAGCPLGNQPKLFGCPRYNFSCPDNPNGRDSARPARAIFCQWRIELYQKKTGVDVFLWCEAVKQETAAFVADTSPNRKQFPWDKIHGSMELDTGNYFTVSECQVSWFCWSSWVWENFYKLNCSSAQFPSVWVKLCFESNKQIQNILLFSCLPHSLICWPYTWSHFRIQSFVWLNMPGYSASVDRNAGLYTVKSCV